MKTTISIPDALFESAERLAKRLGVSRSRLYATAVAEYVQSRRRSKVTEALDAVYCEEPSEIDAAWIQAQAAALAPEDW